MKDHKLRRRICLQLAVVLIVFVPSLLHAQSTTQTIQGLVTDQSRAVVPGATVTITNLATGIETKASTNETGNYSFQLVPVGYYEVKCELDGLKPVIVPDLRVETGGQVRRDFELELGEATFQIEVVASDVSLQTENATVGTVVENRRVVELPLNGRNVVQLAVLVPGVQFGRRSGLNDGLGGAFRSPARVSL